MRHLIYLVEEYGDGQHLRLPKSSLQQAITNTQVLYPITRICDQLKLVHNDLSDVTHATWKIVHGETHVFRALCDASQG